MTRCTTCDECLGACVCDVQGGYRYQDVDNFVWTFDELVQRLSEAEDVEED